MLYTVYGLDFDNQKVNPNNQKTVSYLPTKDSIEGAVEINLSKVRTLQTGAPRRASKNYGHFCPISIFTY